MLQKAKRVALSVTVSLIWKDNIAFDHFRVVFSIKHVVFSVLYSLYPHDIVTSVLCG